MNKGQLIRCDSPRALREGLEDRCYAVSTSDQKAARRLLSEHPAVTGVEPSGARLHVFVQPGTTTPDALRSLLSARNIEPREFELILPSLEDVFINLVRKSEATHAHA